MFSPRWNKIIRDLWLNLPRTLLVILAIAIGIFGVGFVLNSFSILDREIAANIALTNPASATLLMDTVNTDAVNMARHFPGVADAEPARNPIRGRAQVGPNQWLTFLFVVVDDFNKVRINRFLPESGRRTPGDGEILIERSSLSMVNAAIGSKIQVKTLSGAPRELRIAGTVWDPRQDPAWVNNNAYGYITPNTLEWLGGDSTPNIGLRIIVSEDSHPNARQDRAYIRDVANRLSAALRREGYAVNRVEVPMPGRFQQSDRINSFMFLLEAFGVLCLILGGLMSAALISALLSQQIRQIGVMKAIGARAGQIMGVYFGTVLSLSLAALIIAIPLGVLAGRAFTLPVMETLNFNITSGAIPLRVYMIQIAVGILIPLLTAAYPIYRGSRVTVREAISDYGVSLKNLGTSHNNNFRGRLSLLPRPLALSLRNVFRRRGRMILSLVMLAAGGASFIATLGSAASWNQTIANAFAKINYDIDIRLAKPYPMDVILKSIRAVPGVTGVEAWGYAMSTAFPKYSDGTYGGPFAVLAPRTPTTLISPHTLEGRWLQPVDTNALVVDTDFTDKAEKQGTPVRVGDTLTLNLNGRDTPWRVVGIVDKLGVQSASYVNYDYFAGVMRQQGLAAAARVVIAGHDQTLQKTVVQALEQKLAQDGIQVFVIQGLTLTRRVMVNHVVLILVLLMLMSILVAAVGALGLASTMSVNVRERAREIGIMRSVGARARTIIQIVIIEGIIIGIISWLLGALASIPLTYYITGTAGQFIFPRVMAIIIPAWAPLLWLAIIIAVSAAASYYPARRAAQLTIREVLAYE